MERGDGTRAKPAHDDGAGRAADATADDIDATADDVDATADDIDATTDDVAAATDDVGATTDDADATTDDVDAAADDVDAHIRSAVVTWPEIDPEVEGIVSRIDRADRLIDKAATVNLARFDLTHEEFKVLIRLQGGPRTHGSLSRELVVSTGAMTNRLDKMERTGLLARRRDPSDRRGVLLELTDQGRQRLDDYIALAARRERELLGALNRDEKHELNRLLRKLLAALQSELG